MKAFISLAVAPEAREYLFFLLLYFLTESSQILWVTKPLHSEGCHSLFSPWLPSLCSPLNIMNTYPGWVYERSLWRQAWWMLCDSASKSLLWWEHLSRSPLLRLQALCHEPLPSSSCSIAIQPIPRIKDLSPSGSGASNSASESRSLPHTEYQPFHYFLCKSLSLET